MEGTKCYECKRGYHSLKSENIFGCEGKDIFQWMTLVGGGGGGGGRGAKEATFPDPNNFKANLYDMIVL